MGNRNRAALLVVLMLMAAPTAANAQDTLSVAARLVMRQPAGTVLRLNAGGRQVTGVLERVSADSLYLSAPPAVLPLVLITDAWLQRRATGTGAKVGALIGAPIGAVLFGFGTVLLYAACESDCGELGAGPIAVGALIGAAAGTATGLLVGALFGSSVPRWERLTDASAPPTIVSQDAPRVPRLSSINLVPVITRAADGATGVSTGGSISYLSQLSRHVALGAEVGIYDVQATPFTYSVPCGPPDMLCTVEQDVGRSWSAGGLARFGIGAERPVEPYALLGLGVTDFGVGNVTLGGYSAGAGVRYRRSRFAVSGEARRHSNLTNSGDDRELGFYTFGVALTLLR